MCTAVPCTFGKPSGLGVLHVAWRCYRRVMVLWLEVGGSNRLKIDPSVSGKL